MRSVGDIALNPSLRKRKREYSSTKLPCINSSCNLFLSMYTFIILTMINSVIGGPMTTNILNGESRTWQRCEYPLYPVDCHSNTLLRSNQRLYLSSNNIFLYTAPAELGSVSDITFNSSIRRCKRE